MSSLTISIFGNQTFLHILNELKLFTTYKITNFDNLDLCIQSAKKNNNLIVFFKNTKNQKLYNQIIKEKLPLIIIDSVKKKEFVHSHELVEKINMPFKILDFQKKIISVFAKNEFSKSSLINLKEYIIDRNQRKIKKNNIELKLTEKEIDFLILFTKSDKPLKRNFVLEKVWKYSADTDTHTIETHIHRLRKKILQKFKDNNFIKNNDKGYYI